jgi:hypothetical protein
MDSPWNKFEKGWSAFLTDLTLGDLDPYGKPIAFMGRDWVKGVKDGETFSWTKTLPDGKILVIFND